MIVKQIHLSNAAKDKLARLKGKTGIQNWNVLCRWAFCLSLQEETVPTDIEINSDSNVEMSWFTFAGEYHEIYEALIKQCVWITAWEPRMIYWQNISSFIWNAE